MCRGSSGRRSVIVGRICGRGLPEDLALLGAGAIAALIHDSPGQEA